MDGQVTSNDTAAARAAWEHARDTGAPQALQDALRVAMEDVWRAQAQQFREEFWAERGMRPDPAYRHAPHGTYEQDDRPQAA